MVKVHANSPAVVAVWLSSTESTGCETTTSGVTQGQSGSVMSIAVAVTTASTATTTSVATRLPQTATEGKVSKSSWSPYGSDQYLSSEGSSSDSEGDIDDCVGQGIRALELKALREALSAAVCCKKCHTAKVIFKENLLHRQGLCTQPSLP